MAVHILIVDDTQEWRKQFSALLRKEQGFDIAGEASDGLTAVAMVREFRPSVVVLDINMPKLNGIEAARQIRGFSADTKIVFVSGEDHREVVEEALRIGASGFVSKLNVWRDLVAAIHAVLRNEAFVSPGLHFPGLRGLKDSKSHAAGETIPCMEA